ncbi:MAG: DUF1573 domain-containing protein [Isosphaeraceae bacterium]
MTSSDPARQTLGQGERKRRLSLALSPPVALFVATNAVLLAAVIWAMVAFGSLDAAIGFYLRGMTLVPDSRCKTFGAARRGKDVPVSFTLTNNGRRSVRVLGCQASCACMVPEDLPFTLRSGESRALSIAVRRRAGLPGEADEEPFDQEIILFTSDRAQPQVALTVKGSFRN